jgi:transposase-like protein
MPQAGPRYSEAEARAAIAASRSYSEALRRLGMRSAGGNHRTLRRYAEDVWGIPVSHFDPDAARRGWRREPVPLAEVLVTGSTYQRALLKERLFGEGLKERRCELCGQGELWHGRRMSLILDHVNGVADDNRLENLRIVCANCNATLDTHCGRNTRVPRAERACAGCGALFVPRGERHRYCSRACGQRAPRRRGPQPGMRRVERPPYERLLHEIEELGYLAVGRRYGVSDNAVRKWRLAYEADPPGGTAVHGCGADPPPEPEPSRRSAAPPDDRARAEPSAATHPSTATAL